MTIWFVLKVLHVFAGVFWVGAGITMVVFVAPSVSATAPAGGAVMAHLSAKLKFPMMLAYAAWLTTLAGIALFWNISGGLEPVFFTTTPGIALTAGSVLGILAFIGAVFIQIPRSKKIASLSGEAGGSPTEAQAATIGAEQAKFALGGKIVIALLLLSLFGMLMGHPI